MSDVFIVASARTPMGSFQGELSALSAPQLGAAAIAAAMDRSEVSSSEISETVMGCVLPAGVGQAPARQAARQAGIPDAVPATTINKVCGSGMKAIMVAADGLALGRGSFAVAGGMESMSNAPYLLPKARGGYRLGHGEVKDHMFLDGLEDASEHRLMGTYAEDAARHFQFTREHQDAYATESLLRAKRALAEGDFEAEIAPVTPAGRPSVTVDEPPRKADPAKIPLLRPVFAPDGTVTAANSSSISDGAAAVIMANTDGLRSQSIKPVARIVAHASFAMEPRWFTKAPVGAVRKVLDAAGWSVEEVDLFEVNEAFAAVAMIAMRDLGLPQERLNVNGGACALGHPIGCSGARIVVTLLHALAKRGLKKGVASLCIGGGEATALALEMAS
jgi:acetyl-CoA C-acetyltransferase